MKAKILALTTAIAITMSTSVFALEEVNKIESVEGIMLSDDVVSSADMFEQARLSMIEDELESYGVLEEGSVLESELLKNSNVDSLSADRGKFDIVMSMVSNSNLDSQDKQDLMEKIERLSEATVVHIDSDTGEVFDSENGFVGYAESVEEQNFIQDQDYENEFEESVGDSFVGGVEAIEPLSKNNPTSRECHGGNTGAFERKQLGYNGFDKITSSLTLPTITIPSTDSSDTKKIKKEQSWVYYGFDSKSGSAIEGGFAHQTGSARWLPFIRVGSIHYQHSNNVTPYYDGNTINDFNFVLKKPTSSSSRYTAYLYIGSGNLLLSCSTNFTTSDVRTMSVKRMTTIAKNGFDSTSSSPAKAIYTKSRNQRFSNIRVRRFGKTSYENWGAFS
ncbi:MAG: hypothetical protein Q3993_06620, partial [Filifactor alocis]|nr:hypothetical protein [Filifactor alocis]